MYTFRIIDLEMDIDNVIHIAGLTVSGETVYCKVFGYEPYCFLELPVDIKWNGPKIEALKEYIKTRLQDDPPDVMKFEIKKMCLYSVTRPILRINFKNENSWRHLKNILKYTWRVPGFTKEFEPNAFKLHEHNIPSIVKFGIERKLDMSGWVTVKAIKTDLPKDFSRCTHSVYTKPSFVSKADIGSDVLVDPLICSFDIELHSTNRKSSSPKPEIPENVITMISLTFGRLSKSLDEWDTYVITQYIGDVDPDGKYKAKVIDCKGSEKTLILEFCKLFKRKMPDIVTGYNINGFDWACLVTRAKLHDIESELYDMGKLKNEKGRLVDLSWESSARGIQDIKYIKNTGIFNFDLYPEIRFNHTLPMYKLSFVAKHFLGGDENKEDMPYQQMFAIFDMVEVLERNMENSGIEITHEIAKKLILSKVAPEELLEISGMTNHVAEFYKQLKETGTLSDIIQVARGFMLKLLKYVIQDARICPALIKFLNSLTALWENSNISKCPPNYIYEKGQQIKVLAQYADQAYNRNYVVPFYSKVSQKPEDEEEDEDGGKKNYQGATVLKVKKGLYKNIAVLDFASLYPSIMKAYNICHTQLVPEGDPTLDCDCNIAKWSEHIRCEHDPEKRKKKKGEKAYCGDHLYRFRKHNGQDDKKGLLPLLLDSLGKSRSVAKKSLAAEQSKWTAFKKREGELTGEEKKEMQLAYTKSLVLDSRQLAIKISMNSVRGDTPIPCLLDGKFVYMTIEHMGKNWVVDADGNELAEPIDGLKVWSDTGFTEVKYVFRHEIKDTLKRVNTHVGCVDVTEDHSLLDLNGNEVTTKNLSIGDELMHKPVPLPDDTPKEQLYDIPTIKQNILGLIQGFNQEELLAYHYGITEYDSIPDYILQSPFSIRHAYFIGYCMGNYMIIESLRAAQLYFLMKSLGYKVNVNIVHGAYVLECNGNTGNQIKEIINIFNPDSYVYDIETSSHHFAAGVGDMIVHNSSYGFLGATTGYFPLIEGAASVTYYGREAIMKSISLVESKYSGAEVIYGDTDSVFIDFHEKDLKIIFEKAHDAEKFITSNFPPEMKIEMDHCYSPLLLKTKKKYSFTIVDQDGTALKEGSKGDINKRRDNCDAARDIYTLTETLIKTGASQDHILYEINNKILDIYRGLVPLHNFVIYKGLKQLIEEYKNCAGHVLFAKRLQDRGNVMGAGTRLEYVFIKKRGKELKSGERMEDWTYFLMNRAKENLQIDYGYYIEHNVLKPTTEILNIAFPAPEKQFYKPEDSFKRAMEIYLRPKWKAMLEKQSLEVKAKYIAKYSKKKILREAARTFYAKLVLDKLYKQHGYKTRQGHKPKIGQSVIFLNDRVILQIHKYHYDWNEVLWQINTKSGLPDWIQLRWER